MMDIDAYNPFPNAILFNWATIFVLGFGNLAALDFQVCRVYGFGVPMPRDRHFLSISRRRR